MVTEAELAYTAGIIDGEGCIGIHKTEKSARPSQRYALIVSVTSTNEELCNWLQLRFGGCINFWEESKRRNPKHKDRYTWVLHRRKAVQFLGLILPFLLLKKLQAENAVAFQNTFRKGRIGRQHDETTEKELAVREACRIVACGLNQKGVSS